MVMDSRAGGSGIVETEAGGVTRYLLGKVRAYRIPVRSFPGHVTNVYLILDGDHATLIDVGFNSDQALSDLLRGFRTVGEAFGEDVRPADVQSIVITHGHGDHFAMLGCEQLKGKTVYMSAVDSPVVSDYHGEYCRWRDYLQVLVDEAGCSPDFGGLYDYDDVPIRTGDYEIVPVSDGEPLVNGYRVVGTPGHSPGHICVAVDRALFLGDHMLSVTTPHQVPRASWGGAGLEVYLRSLEKVSNMGMDLGLPGHEDTIYSIKGRAEEIGRFHYRRLDEVVGLCGRERSLYEVTDEYYRRHPELIQSSSVNDLGVEDFILALEEIKAHLEYLVDEGRLSGSAGAGGVVRYRSR
jgi:glyoxylase-like metal-dependent hydrolase (beta-lactamase superfamily II)